MCSTLHVVFQHSIGALYVYSLNRALIVDRAFICVDKATQK